MGIEPGPSGEVANTLNHWVVTPSDKIHSSKEISKGIGKPGFKWLTVTYAHMSTFLWNPVSSCSDSTDIYVRDAHAKPAHSPSCKYCLTSPCSRKKASSWFGWVISNLKWKSRLPGSSYGPEHGHHWDTVPFFTAISRSLCYLLMTEQEEAQRIRILA